MTISVSRRRMWWAVLLAPAAQAQSVDDLRVMAAAHGVRLGEERLQVLRPVLERRRAQLETLRSFAIAEAVEPTQGIGRR